MNPELGLAVSLPDTQEAKAGESQVQCEFQAKLGQFREKENLGSSNSVNTATT